MKAQAENGKNSLTESKNLAFWKIKKKKRNSNYLYYVPGTKTEGTSQPSKSPVCKLFNVWDRNQKIMLPETRWKKRHISKFEHILHCLGSVLSHWMRGAPVDLASVENNCIPHKVSEGMFVFEATFWLCLCGGGGVWCSSCTSSSTVPSFLSFTSPRNVLTHELCVFYGSLLWYFPSTIFGSVLFQTAGKWRNSVGWGE